MNNYNRATNPVARVVDFIRSESVSQALKNLYMGDHIACNRTVYSHHGIYDGKGMVYEYNEGVIRHVSLRNFSNGDNILTINSPVSYYPEDIIKRAQTRLGETNYNLIFNNCEHYARWCRSGEATHDTRPITRQEAINLKLEAAIKLAPFNNPYDKFTIDESGYEVIQFGNYYINSSTSKTPIDWFVIDKQPGRLLLLSRYGLIAGRYDGKSNNWPSSGVRIWTNQIFYPEAFSEEEKNMILTVNIDGRSTDNVFLLNRSEANYYVGGKDIRYCKATKYAEENFKKRTSYDLVSLKGSPSSWWLRNTEMNSMMTDYISLYGEFMNVHITEIYGCVRPAIWLQF